MNGCYFACCLSFIQKFSKIILATAKIWLSKLAKSYNEVTKICWQLDPNQKCDFSDPIMIFETLLTFEEKEKYKMLEKTSWKGKKNRIFLFLDNNVCSFLSNTLFYSVLLIINNYTLCTMYFVSFDVLLNNFIVWCKKVAWV